MLHLKTFPIETEPTMLGEMLHFLSDSERLRAMRFQNELAKQQFITARFQLRTQLARLLDTSDLEIFISPTGKPYLTHFPDVHFNISHSHRLGVIAISSTAIGVDIEKVVAIDSIAETASTFTTAEELRLIVQADNQTAMFYKLWTAKEALLKTIGNGFTEDISLVQKTNIDSSEVKFTLSHNIYLAREIDLSEGYVGAFCTIAKHPNL